MYYLKPSFRLGEEWATFAARGSGYIMRPRSQIYYKLLKKKVDAEESVGFF